MIGILPLGYFFCLYEARTYLTSILVLFFIYADGHSDNGCRVHPVGIPDDESVSNIVADASK